MKTTPARLAIATMLLAATYAQGRAEDAVLPAPPATPAASAPAADANTPPPSGSPPASVPRPSLVPNTTDTASEKPIITAARPYRRHVIPPLPTLCLLGAVSALFAARFLPAGPLVARPLVWLVAAGTPSSGRSAPRSPLAGSGRLRSRAANRPCKVPCCCSAVISTNS